MKKKVSLPAGRLKELLKERNLPFSGLTKNQLGASIIDIKTLRLIDSGEEVKMETMEKICEPLGLSLQQLLGSPESPMNLNSRVIVFDPFGEIIPAYEARADELADVLRQAARTRKNIDLLTLSTKQEKLILKLEEWLNSTVSTLPPTDQSFSEQIKFKQTNRVFEQIQGELRAHNLKVLVARYKFWERSDEFYNHHDIYFTSTDVVALAIVASSAAGTTFSVKLGEIPPRSVSEYIETTGETSEDPRIKVDGNYL